MSRTNPRSVILAALQEGPCSRINLWWLLMRANGLPDSPHRATPKQARTALRIDGHLDRHLCKLIRSRRVVRLGDGRYALSNPWTRMLARCAKIDMDWRDFLPVPRNADAEAQDIEAILWEHNSDEWKRLTERLVAERSEGGEP